MSKVKKVVKNVGQSLGFIPTNKELEKQYQQQADLMKAVIPETPAAPASAARTTTGSDVVVGTSATKDNRVSGRRAGRGGSTVGSPLGGLGRGGGLSI